MRKTRLIVATGPITDAIQILPGCGFHDGGNRTHCAE